MTDTKTTTVENANDSVTASTTGTTPGENTTVTTVEKKKFSYMKMAFWTAGVVAVGTGAFFLVKSNFFSGTGAVAAETASN